MLLAVAIPTTTTIMDNLDLFTPVAGDGEHLTDAEKPPEYDGSRGLLYAVNEDGKTASMIGFGSCTDEVMYVASHYNGLPVTEVKNQPYYDATYFPKDHGYGNRTVKRIVFSDTVVKIWSNVINVCPNLESVYFGANVEDIPVMWFNGQDGKNFATVEVSPENKNYSSKGNCIVDLRTKTLIWGLPTTVIPDDGSVEIIDDFAFAPAKWNLTSIVIPEGVKVIGMNAFDGCFYLETVALPDSLEFVDNSAFELCQSLKTLVLGTNLKAFDARAFHSAYCPEIYYKGTVGQWEAISKRVGGSGGKDVAATVHCTDGDSLLGAGNHETVVWQWLPEYSEYWERNRPTPVYPDLTK